MQFLASFTMRGLSQATLVVVVAAMLSLLMPLFSYLSGAAVGLVTLRMGYRKGLGVMLLSAAVMGLFTLILLGQAHSALAYLVVVWLPVLLLCERLRRQADYAASLLQATLLGMLLVLGINLMVDAPQQWWAELLGQLFGQLAEEGGQAQADNARQLVAALAPLMTGLFAAAFAFSAIASLSIARWWQALLYNQGGFRSEFHALRFARPVQLFAAMLLAIGWLTSGELALFANHLLMVMMPLFVLQGLAVVHSIVTSRKANSGWLIGLYTLLLLAMPQTSFTLAVAGFLDNWVDFRALFGKQLEN